MRRALLSVVIGAWALSTAVACRGAGSAAPDARSTGPLEVVTATARKELVNGVLQITGSLVAEQEAEVAAETTGRVVATPVERGSRVNEGAVLVALSKVEADAQAQEASANVAQLEARLALTPGEPFDVEKVAEVASARASRDLAEADFGRIKSLLDERVVSQAEYDQRRTQLEAARNLYAVARNGAQQQYRMLEGARARAALARKNLADTDVRAPFSGIVVERKVGIGDFVTRGTKVATIVQSTPLRLELTVPEQSIGLVTAGQTVHLQVDSFPGRVFEGQVRYVAPALRADQRALTVEAVVPNGDGTLKPGMFATAELRLPAAQPLLVVPSEAVQAAEGISRLYVIREGKAEERIVTTGLVSQGVTEVLSGLSEGEEVACAGLTGLRDGSAVKAVRRAAPGPSAAR